MNGIVVAITVMNCTFASSGTFAICNTALATLSTSITGSTFVDPSACGTPVVIRMVMSDAAFPTSICPQAMLNARPSSEIDRVRPVIACFELV